MRFTLCPPCVHLSVCLPNFCPATASLHPRIILAFCFSINLTLFVHPPDGLSCSSLLLSACPSAVGSLPASL